MSASRELLEMRFRRFLHYGSEQPIYRTGSRIIDKAYTRDHIPSLLKLIHEAEPSNIIEMIIEVRRNDTSAWPDSIIFALAVCAEQDVSKKLRSDAYSELRTVCKTSRDILLFVKFYRDLMAKQVGGSGFKKAIAQWYLVWMPFDLADMFLHQRSYFNWTHSDVLRVAHVKPISIEQQLLFTYVRKGLEEAKKRYGDSTNEQIVELLDYIMTVENFKRIKDPEQAAKALSLELHNIERVPVHLMKSQAVWNELIPNMDVKTLLDNLQRISILGFLKNNNVTVTKVVDVFNNLWKAEMYKGHPSRVYIELMTYEKAAKYCLDIAAKMNHPISKITPARKPPKCNLVIKNALIKFFYSQFKFQKPTGLRFLVAVDVRPKMFSDRSHHCLHVTPIEAAEVICLSLVNTEGESNVTVGVFLEPKGELEVIPITKDAEISKYHTVFTEKGAANAGPASIASAIHWAEEKKKHFDVILVLSNHMVVTSGSRPAIVNYRANMKKPNAKLITCSLSGNVRTHKDVEGHNMMCIIGFDEHVCHLISSFARDCF